MAAKTKKTAQTQKFIDKARELGCDEDEAAFEDKLKQIAKAKRAESKPKRQALKLR